MSEEKNTSANAIVIYQSMYKQFLRLSKKNPEMAIEYITALLKYGFEGIEPDEDSDVMMYGFDADKIALDNAAVRYLKAQENGAKGGRPSTKITAAMAYEKYEQLHNWDAVAKYFGTSRRTLERIRQADKASGAPCDKSDKTSCDRCDKTDATDASNTTNATMRQNLDIEIEIEKDIETEKEKEQDPLDKWDRIAYGYLPPHLVPKTKTRNSS